MYKPKFQILLEIISRYMMVTAIQADPEVAFRKLPSKNFSCFILITSKSD